MDADSPDSGPRRSRCPRLPALVLCLAAPALAQAGQDTHAGRAASLEEAREARKVLVAPPSRSTVERALYWYDTQGLLARLFAGWHGVHIVGGDFPAGAGTAAGVGLTRDLGAGLGVDARVAGSTNGYARGEVTVRARALGGSAVDLGARVGAYDHPQEDFFGLGSTSDEAARSSYRLTGIEGETTVTWRPLKSLRIEAGLAYLSPRVGAGTDTRMPSTDERFDVATLPGYTTPTDFLRADLGLVVDRRDEPRHPHAGGRYEVRIADYRDLESIGFRQGEFDLQQYVPLPDRHRTLALGASGVFTDAHPDTDVPFYLQPTLGGARLLRGFREFRFRDRQAVAVSAEYRWEAWWALDGALFVDAGTVAPRADRLRLRDVDVSYGVGLRLHSNSAFIARLDLAFSREGFIPLLRFDHVF